MLAFSRGGGRCRFIFQESTRALGDRHMGQRCEVRKGELLAGCEVKPELFEGVRERLKEFVQPFADRLCRMEQKEYALSYVEGLLSVPYGRGVTLLFSGPPGVGKTACAEATASRLRRDIIVADYAELQSCWVGQTEKNIVRIFRQAADDDAVLFWDEADGMFFDRDGASRSFEVRDVNVLLQELERFNGLCILSTNRKPTLDKALERRIAIKIEFEPPDRARRLEIWTVLIPAKLPLATDVSTANLAEHELTGGEIKNVVLNAARIALVRGPRSRVTAFDFDRAIAMETGARWSCKGKMGFAASEATA